MDWGAGFFTQTKREMSDIEEFVEKKLYEFELSDKKGGLTLTFPSLEEISKWAIQRKIKGLSVPNCYKILKNDTHGRFRIKCIEVKETTARREIDEYLERSKRESLMHAEIINAIMKHK